MDNEIEKRLTTVEAIIPHLATKADVQAVDSKIGSLSTQVSTVLPHLATKADLSASENKVIAMFGTLDVKITAVDVKITALDGKISRERLQLIQWGIATIVGVAALTFAIARFVH